MSTQDKGRALKATNLLHQLLLLPFVPKQRFRERQIVSGLTQFAPCCLEHCLVSDVQKCRNQSATTPSIMSAIFNLNPIRAKLGKQEHVSRMVQTRLRSMETHPISGIRTASVSAAIAASPRLTSFVHLVLDVAVHGVVSNLKCQDFSQENTFTIPQVSRGKGERRRTLLDRLNRCCRACWWSL